MGEIKGDPKLFRELSEPFQSVDEVNEKLEGFRKEIGELRKKYKIPNLCVAALFSYTAGGEEAEAFWNASFGDALKVEGMLAYALGETQAARQAMIDSMLSKGRKRNLREL